MLIKCLSNTGNEILQSNLNELNWPRRETVFDITPGKVYFVDCITMWRDNVWYYIIDDNELYYPTWYPAELFEIIDFTMPFFWIFGLETAYKDRIYPIISFPEWANDLNFYEKLIGGDEEAIRIFNRYKNC